VIFYHKTFDHFYVFRIFTEILLTKGQALLGWRVY